jgi:Na+/phosphate symporter
LYNQKALLEDLKDKMSSELQKTLTIESYKATDLHEFVKMCRYTNQILRDVNNKSRREDFISHNNADDVEREKIIVIVNSNQNNNRSISRSRFEISETKFELNSRAITQSSSFENQVNFLNCYNCEKSDHFSSNCRQFKKSMNLNSFVREMNVQEKNDAEKNFEQNSKKE